MSEKEYTVTLNKGVDYAQFNPRHDWVLQVQVIFQIGLLMLLMQDPDPATQHTLCTYRCRSTGTEK